MLTNLTAILTALCEALDQNELYAFGEDGVLLPLVDKLLECQPAFSDTFPPRSTDALLNWYSSNGGECKANICTVSPGNFGLQAVSLVEENDVVAKIPQKLLITADCGNCPELYVLCNSDSTLSSMPNLRLSLNLLNERLNSKSLWTDYINALPKQYSTLLYFTMEDFRLLKPSPAFVTCTRLFCKLLGSYVYLYSKFFGQDADKSISSPKILFTAENFTFAAFRWAVSTVMTRQNNVPFGGGLALVPVLDMLNHDTHLKPSVDFDSDTGQVIIYAARTFTSNEEIRIFYGARSNHDLFVHNGFALDDNPSDSFYLQISFKMIEMDDEKRKKLLARLRLERDCFKLTMANPLPHSLLACLHLEFAPDESIDVWLGKSIADALDDLVAEKTASLHPDIYRKAYVWLAAQIGIRLRTYKDRLAVNSDSAKTDLELETRNNILTLLQCEKRILEGLIAKLQLLLQK